MDSLNEAFGYDPETGLLHWKKPARGRTISKEPGSVSRLGYRQIGHGGKVYLGHRLAWFLFHGQWPGGDLDHVDGDRLNNRLTNLRLATRAENCWNRGAVVSSSGVKGTYWFKNGWNARICVGGKRIFLGRFKTQEGAARAYWEAAQKHFGEFARAAAA